MRHVARFVVSIWHDNRFDDRSAREFTSWALGELLPSPPISLPHIGALVLTHSTAHHVVRAVYSEIWRYRNPDRATKTIVEVASALGLSRAEYLEIAGAYLDALSTRTAGEDQEAIQTVHALLAQAALLRSEASARGSTTRSPDLEW